MHTSFMVNSPTVQLRTFLPSGFIVGKFCFFAEALSTACFLTIFVVAVVVVFIQWCSLYLLFGRTELFKSRFYN